MASKLSFFMVHQVGLLALKVGHVALRALHSTTAALDLYEQVIIPVTSKQEGVQPPPPDTPQMLPSIHVLWGALVGTLRVRFLLRPCPLAPPPLPPPPPRPPKLCTCISACAAFTVVLTACLMLSRLLTLYRQNPHCKCTTGRRTKHVSCRAKPWRGKQSTGVTALLTSVAALKAAAAGMSP